MPSPYEHYLEAERLTGIITDMMAEAVDTKVWKDGDLQAISAVNHQVASLATLAQVHATLATYQGTLPAPDPVEVPES